jgi:hypothetical protein
MERGSHSTFKLLTPTQYYFSEENIGFLIWETSQFNTYITARFS